MVFTDTHAHIFVSEFDEDRAESLYRAFQAGVNRIFVPNIDQDTIRSLKDACEPYTEKCFPMMGLHPSSVQENYNQVLSLIHSEFVSGKYYGVGEIGMDLYWDKSTYEWQKHAFIEQANWAIDSDLPVSIHSREATGELIKIIQEEKLSKLRGVFHCFSGTVEEGKTLMNMGFYLGIGGVVTFKNSGLRSTLSQLGTDNLVLETDSPYLAPVPHRGKRNECSFIPLIAATLAEIFDLSLEEIAEITTNNSKKVFRI